MRGVVIVAALLLPLAASSAGVPVMIDTATEHQVIDGFGANQPQYYYATDYFDAAILDLTFKRSGMGLSILRCEVPLGFEGVEGTAAGNDNADPQVIDWAGFDKTVADSIAAVAQGAAARGCQKFIATPWSPPYWMKTGNSEIGGSLIPGMEPELAEYFRAFLTYLSGATGEVSPPVVFDYLTLQNEPEVLPGWWGCFYSPSDLVIAMQSVGNMLQTEFPAVTLAAGDNATTAKTLQYLATIMGDPVVEPQTEILSVHPYAMPWSNPDSQSSVINRWAAYRAQTQGYGRRTWMTEHCDADYPTPDPARAGWTSGLNGATHVHRALVDGHVNAWLYWTLYRRDADQPNQGYGHSLWYSEASDDNATLQATGKVSALTPFSRYVRPGYRRVEASPADASTPLRVTAFKAPGGVDQGLVVVVINRSAAEVQLDGSIADEGSIASLRRCEAAEYDSGGTARHGVRGGSAVDLLGGVFDATVPANSVTAFVHEAGTIWPTAEFDHDVSGLRVSVNGAASLPATIERYEWDFGDGTTAAGVSPVHDYAAAGTYSVVLTVTEQQGGVHTVSQSVSVQGAEVSGSVVYYRTETGLEPGDTPVGDVTLDLQGETFSDASVSQATGSYAFQDLPFQNITVTPSKLGETDGISSLDAARVSQFRVGLAQPTPNQRIAADVSGNGTFSSYDAALISQFRVGMIPSFPIAQANGSDWAFVPTARTYAPLDSDRTNEDYLGILYGDVTGNWSPPGGKSRGTTPDPGPGRRSVGVKEGRLTDCTLSLRLTKRSDAPQGMLQWILSAVDCRGLLGLDLDFAYDPDRVTITRTAATNSGSAFAMTSDSRDGRLRLAMYCARPLLEDGDILVITAETAGPVSPMEALAIRSAEANEGRIPVSLQASGSRPRR